MAAPEKLKNIIEAALLAAGGPLSLDMMLTLFLDEEQPEKKELREVLDQLKQDYEGRGIQVVEVVAVGVFKLSKRCRCGYLLYGQSVLRVIRAL